MEDGDADDESDGRPGGWDGVDEVWNLIGDMTMEGGEMGGVAVVVASRVLSITSAMLLRVELRVLEIITGFKSLVLLFDVHLELGGHTPLALCLHFQLPASLTLPVPVATEYAEQPKPIEVLHC